MVLRLRQHNIGYTADQEECTEYTKDYRIRRVYESSVRISPDISLLLFVKV